jgi:serine/threonine protein kinase
MIPQLHLTDPSPNDILSSSKGNRAMECPRCRLDNPEEARFCGHCAAPLSDPSGVPPITVTIRRPQAFRSAGSILAGKFRIIGPIGQGGMGIVYKAEDIKIKRTVALKFLPPDVAVKLKPRARSPIPTSAPFTRSTKTRAGRSSSWSMSKAGASGRKFSKDL